MNSAGGSDHETDVAYRDGDRVRDDRRVSGGVMVRTPDMTQKAEPYGASEVSCMPMPETTRAPRPIKVAS